MNTFHRHLLTAVAVASLAALLERQARRPGAGRDAHRRGRRRGQRQRRRQRGAAARRRGSRRSTSPATSNVDYSNLPRIVYFDFDSYVVKDEYRPVIEANAKALTANRKSKMAVEGHTDERGSSEYNLALGQSRAEAVVKSLTLLGAEPAQLEAVSFGKERPAVQGENEEAWAKNRRAELASR